MAFHFRKSEELSVVLKAGGLRLAEVGGGGTGTFPPPHLTKSGLELRKIIGLV